MLHFVKTNPPKTKIDNTNDDLNRPLRGVTFFCNQEWKLVHPMSANAFLAKKFLWTFIADEIFADNFQLDQSLPDFNC